MEEQAKNDGLDKTAADPFDEIFYKAGRLLAIRDVCATLRRARRIGDYSGVLVESRVTVAGEMTRLDDAFVPVDLPTITRVLYAERCEELVDTVKELRRLVTGVDELLTHSALGASIADMLDAEERAPDGPEDSRDVELLPDHAHAHAQGRVSDQDDRQGHEVADFGPS